MSNKFNIIRDRYIVVRGDREVFCGLARSFHFKNLDEIDKTSIKTYHSENKAKSAVMSSFRLDEEDWENGDYRVIKVKECIFTVSPEIEDKVNKIFKR